MVALDVDALKAVNDTMGHRAGDQLLEETAARLGETLRRSDFLARLSGDEFAAILPEAGAHDAEAVARKLIAALEATRPGSPASGRGRRAPESPSWRRG